MSRFEKLTHVIWHCQYHIVWVPKYRFRVLKGEMAQEVHGFIRKLLNGLYDAATAEQIRIQYGGSMKPSNAKELLGQPDIDGGLIGGAALKADDFNGIVQA